ncbi:MAG: methyltransferase domain-containing protein, partial [Candidatus Diapherotrites archaeon]|nr:methyltransferase domain-containing protein [Candidatus Diapherotrites archaeon]
GCGNAEALRELKYTYLKDIYCVGLDLVKRSAKDLGIDEYISGDAFQEKFPDNVDFVFSFRALHEIGRISEIVEKVSHCLASKGLAVLSIRCQDFDFHKNKLIFQGQISQKDLDFLNQILLEKEFYFCKVSGNPIFQEANGITYTAGINLILKKE